MVTKRDGKTLRNIPRCYENERNAVNPSDDGPLMCQVCGETGVFKLDENATDEILCYGCNYYQKTKNKERNDS